jgi:hypothetical protein
LLGPIGDAISEFNARAHWTRATGFVDAATVRDASERQAPGHASGTHTFCWAQFEVTFKPTGDCSERGSTLDAASGALSCPGTIISHPENSDVDARAWFHRHGRGRPAELLYDPNGTGIRFAHESLLNVVEWDKFFGGILLLAVGIAVIFVARATLMEFAASGVSAT